MKTVVGYGRYSSDAQKECSIEIQKNFIEKFCHTHDLKLDKFFADYAKSGSTTDGRDEFKKMREYLFNNDDITGVVVYKLDRLGRNTEDYLVFLNEALRRGKTVQSYAEMHSTEMTPTEMFQHTLTAAIAELELATISERTRNGILHKAKQGGGSLGGKPPLGYLRPDANKPLVIDAGKAEIVKMIFDLYVNHGKGYGEIAKILNSYGYLTQRNREFGKNSIRDILLNERYIGTEVYNRAEGKKLGKDGKYHYNSHRSKPDEQIIRHPGAHEAIISEDLFYRAQDIMKKKSRHGGKKGNALFKGIIRCGICGATMHLDTHTSKHKNGKTYITRKYRCNCYNDGKKHGKIDADIAEGLFLKLLKRGLFRHVKSKDLLGDLDEFFKEFSTDYKKIILHKEKNDKYRFKIDRLTSAIEECNQLGAIKNLMAKIQVYEHGMEEEQEEIARLEKICERNYTVEELSYIIKHFEKLVKSNIKNQETRDFINSYIQQVIVGHDTLDIVFRDEVISKKVK